MPDASVSRDAVRKELKTLEGGYVVLRRLSFGEKLIRRDIATQTLMQQSNKSKQSQEVQFKVLASRIAEFEFSNCIIEHNLEDEKGRLLDFSRRDALDKLDPIIGDEISELIAELVGDDLDEEEDKQREDFPDAHTSSLLDMESAPSRSTETD